MDTNTKLINILNTDIVIKFITNQPQFLKCIDDISNFAEIQSSKRSIDFVVMYIDSASHEACFDEKNKEFVLLFPYSELIGTEIIKTIIGLCVQWTLQDHDVFMLHASCCIDEKNHPHVFWGHSGSGKTSIALELCRKNNWCFYSNGALLINGGSLRIVGSLKKHIKLRFSSVVQQDEVLANKIFFEHHEEDNLYNLKKNVTPEELGIKKAEGEYHLRDICFIKLMEDCFFSSRPSPKEIAMSVYSDISRFVRQSEVYLVYGCDNTLLLPHMDNVALYNKRINFIQNIIENVNVFSLHGSLTECRNFILREQ